MVLATVWVWVVIAYSTHFSEADSDPCSPPPVRNLNLSSFHVVIVLLFCLSPPDLSHSSSSLSSHPSIQPSAHRGIEAQELLIELNSVKDFWNSWEATWPLSEALWLCKPKRSPGSEFSGISYSWFNGERRSIPLPIPLPTWSFLPQNADKNDANSGKASMFIPQIHFSYNEVVPQP